MKFDQFIRPGQGRPLHSNGLVGGSAGSSGGASFSTRKQVHGRANRMVRSYQESKLANMESQRNDYRASRAAVGKKIDIVRSTRGKTSSKKGSTTIPKRSVDPRTFTEPTSRSRPH